MHSAPHSLVKVNTTIRALAGVAPWYRPGNQRVARCDSQSGHMTGLQARPPEEVCERQPHIDVSLPLSLPLFEK